MGEFGVAQKENEGIGAKEMLLNSGAQTWMGLLWREILWIIIGQSLGILVKIFGLRVIDFKVIK